MVSETLKTERAASSAEYSRKIVGKLSRSKIYRDYEHAFTKATGLPLALRPVEMFQCALHEKKKENPFCALMAETNRSCAACLEVQGKLEKEAKVKPKTLKCFAGLCDTAIPVRVGDNLVAFLQTGQILLHRPNKKQFNTLTRKLLSWGTKVDLKRLEEAYFQTHIFSLSQYRAFVQLLATFAEHLGTISNAILVQESQAEPKMVVQTRRYVLENYQVTAPLKRGSASRQYQRPLLLQSLQEGHRHDFH